MARRIAIKDSTFTVELGKPMWSLRTLSNGAPPNIDRVKRKGVTELTDSANLDRSKPKNSILNPLPRVMETSRVALKLGSRSSNESGRIGVEWVPEMMADRMVILCALGKQMAGRMGLANGVRGYSSVVIVMSSKYGSVTTRFSGIAIGGIV